MKKTRSSLTVGIAFAGLCISAWLTVSETGLAEEKAEDILAKAAMPIKDIANLQELEEKTFYVVNITEHNSVLSAELRLAGTEADWAEGLCGYVDGKEIPTGLLPAGDHIRLMVCVPLKPREVKKVTFKKGRGAAATDLKVKQDGSRVTVANKYAHWKLGPNGLEQFQRGGKTCALQEIGISNGTLKVMQTPAVCLVTLQAEGLPLREYLFYPDSPLWQVNADKNYKLIADGTNAFYYSHPCTMFYGDPGSPYGAVIETGELEKGGGGQAGLKEFHLFSGADWGMLMGQGIGLGVYPNPSAHTILVDTTKRNEGVLVQAVPIDEHSNTIFKKWHCGGNQESYCGCGWWRTKAKPLGDTISYIFGATADVKEGAVQRSGSLTPVLLRFLGDRLHGAQLPWTTASLSETIYVEDIDGNGPDMLHDRWFWCNNGKPASSFEFNDPNKDGLLDDVYICRDWDDNGELDSSELKYPVCALHDQTRDGKIVANCLFFGGRIDQDWYETTSHRSGRADIEKTVRTLGEKKFSGFSRALDIDGDGDMDVSRSASNKQEKGPDTDYIHSEAKYGRINVDLYDNNPFHGVLLDPLAGNLTVKSGFQWPFYLGHICCFCFRYKGVPVAGQDAVVGNMCLDGDGLPEAKLIFDGGLIGEDFLFRPVQNMIGSSLYLSNRHALSKITSWVWQEGPGSSSCYKPDVCLFPIRKNSSWPYDAEFKNTRMMPKRPVKNSITTYRDKWGNEIRRVGALQPNNWDGRLVVGSKNPTVVKDWSDSLRYDWDYLLATFEGIWGVMTESGYPTHAPRWEFCPDYAQRRQAKLFYSELDGRLHLKGALWGHRTPYNMGANRKKEFLDELDRQAQAYLHEDFFCLDCDTMRYYAPRHEAFFDEDRDGYLDCFLVDAENDGWYEERAWYDRVERTVSYMKNGILVMWPRRLEPYLEEELLVDTEHYDKLVALKRMSEERTSVLKGTMIKTQPLSISVPDSNLWVGVGADLLPQVLLDASHTEAGIWYDLSHKGYSRLLTGLQRQKVVVRELKEKWSEESLRGASVLFVAPPYTAKPDADELKALDAFLKRGGRVVLACPDWSVEPQGEAYALRTDQPLTPDGKTGEWAGPQSIDLTLQWEASPDPYCVKISVCPKWDKTHFYFSAEVHDRDLINKEDGVDIWRGDCIQIALSDPGVKWQWFKWCVYNVGGDDDKMRVMGAKGMKWQEYGMARTDKGVQVYRWIDVPGNRAGPVAGAKLEVARLGNRTVYQLALPWTEVGRTNVQSGTELGFAFVVFDRANDRETLQLHVSWGGDMAICKNPAQFRKLILVDKPEDMKAYAGARVDSPLDAMCASYGIHRNPEHTALVPAIDPQFGQRELGSEVSGRFNGDRSDGLMKGVRKLFFSGSSMSVSGSAVPLARYQDKIIAAKAQVGKGELLVLCSEMMLNNQHACFHSFEGDGCFQNHWPLDKLIDAKPDNNVFLDNLARYVVADQRRFKVLKAGDAQATVELAGPGKVYVNKGTKVVPDGQEAISGKENGDMMCFEVPASKDPIKLKISR